MKLTGQTPAVVPRSLNAAPEAVCAVVVAYFPDEGFSDRLQVVLSQVGALVVVDNTPRQAGGRRPLLRGGEGRIHLVENHQNVGIAAALNQGLEYAFRTGSKWLLTLDQDSQCHPDMVATLLQAIAACELDAAVIGGNYFDTHNQRNMVSPVGESGCLEQKTVITSGSLVDVGVARIVGGFREEFFIDQVDHEFCLRVRAHGYRVAITRKPVMDHSVGGGGGVRLPLFGKLPDHSPLRKYYVARNTVVMVAEYWRREPDWCLRRFVRLLLGLLLMSTLEKQRAAKVRAFAAGFADGMRGHMGRCQRDWLR